MEVLKKTVIVAVTTISRYGRAAGESVSISYDALSMAALADSTPINSIEIDTWPFAVSGSRPAYFVGKYGAGFADTWDVTPAGGT